MVSEEKEKATTSTRGQYKEKKTEHLATKCMKFYVTNVIIMRIPAHIQCTNLILDLPLLC